MHSDVLEQREPTTPVDRRWLVTFSVAWFGIWLAQLTPIQLLLPEQVDLVLGRDGAGSDWLASVWAFGVISAIAGVFALVAYPVAGFLADRTLARTGSRAGWIAGGTLVFTLGLLSLSGATNVVGVAIGWTVSLVGFCIVTAALTAVIADQVPVGQRGLVSGLVSAPQAVGIIVGLAVVTAAGWSIAAGYRFSAFAVLLLVIPFLHTLKGRRTPGVAARFRVRDLVGALWVSPRRHPDFGWTLLGRLLVNLSNAIATTLLLYYLKFGLHRSDPQDDLLILSVVYMVFVIIASLGLGRLSDRVGRRKPFVMIAAGTQAAAGLLLVLVSSFPAAIVAGALLGAGYGAFLSVDQALATQVLPDPETRAKDLGIMNIATAVPQAFGPLAGAVVVQAFSGFTGLFALSAVIALAGGATTLFIRSVR